jgi:hypothetical protein
MKFLCLICAEKVMEQMPEVDAETLFEEYREFTDAIRKSRSFIACNRLLPAHTATTVRVRQGKVSTTDGPYAETKEQLGGYYLIEAEDLPEAIRKFPGHEPAASRYERSRRTRGPSARLDWSHSARRAYEQR